MTKEYIIKENTGTAFRNKKNENPNAPHYTGTVNVDGKEKRIAIWTKNTVKGDEMLSCKFSELMAKPEQEEKKEKYVSHEKLEEEGFDDFVPF